MCNGIKTNGEKCGRKQEWCWQHINKKPIEEKEPLPEIVEPIEEKEPLPEIVEPIEEEKPLPEIVETNDECDDVSDDDEPQKNENIELKSDEKKFVQVNIVPPTMSPNDTTISSDANSVILEEPNYQPIKKIFDEYDCFVTYKNREYEYWISKCALGKAHESWTLLANDKNSYLYDIEGCSVIRIDKHYKISGSKRKSSKFIWFYYPVDMHAFIEFFHGQTRFECECHEVFIGRDPEIRLFMDLETVISKKYYDALVSAAKPASLAESVCADIIKALNYTLEAVDERYYQYEKDIDYAITERTRPEGSDEVKISFHIITNIAMNVSECKAVIKLMKSEYIDLIPDIGDEYKTMLCSHGFVDTQPYKKNGSLSLPGATKFGNTVKIVKAFKTKENMHLLELHNCFRQHEFNDDLPIQANQSDRAAFEDASSDFIKKVLTKLDAERVPAYNPEAMDIYANSIRGNSLFVKRIRSSHCPACDRVHDNADTLQLLFNEKQNAAYWKCNHNEDMKFKRWYGKHTPKEIADSTNFSEEDIDAFSKVKLPKPAKASKASRDNNAGKSTSEPKSAKELAQEAAEQYNKDHADALDALYNAVENIDRNVIRERNNLEFNDLAMRDGETMEIAELALLIRQTLILVENNGKSAAFVKSLDERKYGREYISTPTSTPRTTKQLSKYTYSIEHQKDDGEIAKISLSLGEVIDHIKRLINHRKTVLEPFGVLEKDTTYGKRKNFNIFSGFVHIYDSNFVVDEAIVNVWLEHIKIVLANNDEKVCNHLMKYFAHQLINPMIKTGLILIVKGLQGSGKNSPFDIFQRFVIGPNLSITTANMDLVAGRFNSIRQSLLSCVLDEALDNKDRALMNKFKNLITAEETQIEYKGKEPFTVKDFINYVVISNQDFASFIEESDRRAFCLETNDSKRGDSKYFKKFWNVLGNETAGKHIFHWLVRNVDVNGWNPQDTPRTEYKQMLKRVQASSLVKFLLHELDRLNSRVEDAEGYEFSESELNMLSNDDKDTHWGNQTPTPAELWERYLKFIDRAKIKSPMTRQTFDKDMMNYIKTSKSSGRRLKRYNTDILTNALKPYL